MRELLKKGSVIVVLGPGGVGKTTVAAALGMAAAQAGLDTALITVDPARRLREALGIERVSHGPVRLSTRRLLTAGVDASTRLSVTMLDVKRTWDKLVEQFVDSPSRRRTILQNRFYQSLTEQFAGAEAYAALEQLRELHESGQFEVEIVDTPPAAHAFEFFDAPRHLVRLLDSTAARWLFQPESSLGRNALTLASRAAGFVISQLEVFTGSQMLSALAEFFSTAAEAAAGLRERFRTTEAMLHSRNLNFVLVTTPGEDRLKQALELLAHTQQQKLNLRGVVVNRMLDQPTFESLVHNCRRLPGHLADADNLRSILSEDGADNPKFAALVRYLESYSRYQRLEFEQALHFARELPPSVTLSMAPAVEIGVRDLASLAKLASFITRPGGRKLLENAAGAFGLCATEARTGKRPALR
jgi:anion-transporting  ArsA/GET3 family ATPase